MEAQDLDLFFYHFKQLIIFHISVFMYCFGQFLVTFTLHQNH